MISIGKPLKMVVAFVETEENGKDDTEKKQKGKKILSHVGSFDASTNDFDLVEVTIENKRIFQTHFQGKWSKTQQNEKFCGTFSTLDESEKCVESGSFFAQISEISLD